MADFIDSSLAPVLLNITFSVPPITFVFCHATLYATYSALFAVVSVRPSVCLSQAGIVSRRLEESRWLLAWRLLSTYPTMCCKKIRTSPKLSVLSSRTFSETAERENFATANRSRCQQNSSRMELADTCDGRRVVAVYCTSVNCNRLTPLLRFVVHFWYIPRNPLGSRVVSVLDSGAEGPGFKSQPQPRRCRVTVLGKLFTPIVPLCTKQQNW